MEKLINQINAMEDTNELQLLHNKILKMEDELIPEETELKRDLHFIRLNIRSRIFEIVYNGGLIGIS